MILGANGQPIQSEQKEQDDKERMAMLMKKIFPILEENQVPFHEAAAIGTNLILHFIRMQPDVQQAYNCANHMMTGLQNHIGALLNELRQNAAAMQAAGMQQPVGHA